MLITLSSTAHRLEDFDLSRSQVEMLWECEDTHAWYHARNRWILRSLQSRGIARGARILEVGCGAGAVTRFLTTHGYEVTGLDTSAVMLEKAQARCPDVKFFLGAIEQLDPTALAPFDVIALFDVLEHVVDDRELLESALRFGRSGSLVIATVPAQKRLMSRYDEVVGHKRRYDCGEISAMFARSRVKQVEERGMFRTAQQLFRLQRSSVKDDDATALLQRHLRTPSAPVNLALQTLFALELRFLYERNLAKSGTSQLVSGLLGDN